MITGCASVQPLSQVADRARQPRGLGKDVVVDIANRDLPNVHKLAWVSYTVSVDCESGCTLTHDEQQKIAQDLAKQSFTSFDRELRASFKPIQVLTTQESTANAAFAAEIPNDSLTSRIGRWFERLKLSPAARAIATAQGLKTINPNELGWSGENHLQKLAQNMNVDGVLVGHLKVNVGKHNELEVTGPKIWIFAAKKAKNIATARLRQPWRAEASDLQGTTAQGAASIAAIAKSYSDRFAEEIRSVQ